MDKMSYTLYLLCGAVFQPDDGGAIVEGLSRWLDLD